MRDFVLVQGQDMRRLHWQGRRPCDGLDEGAMADKLSVFLMPPSTYNNVQGSKSLVSMTPAASTTPV
jgi:hypothetical protein